MSSDNTGQKNFAKYKKRKLKLSLYSSKAERKYRQFVLSTKRKNSSGQPNLPLKLARLETEGSSSLESGEKTSGVSEGNIGEHSIDILHDGALVEGADLSNPIPTNIDQSQKSDQIFTNLKDHARRILTDKSLLDSLIDKLYDNDLLLHYIAHFEEISYRRLSPMNVAVLLAWKGHTGRHCTAQPTWCTKMLRKGGMPFANVFLADPTLICVVARRILDK